MILLLELIGPICFPTATKTLYTDCPAIKNTPA